jgi:hypothetical protein
MRVSGGDDPSEDAQSQAQAALQRAIDTKAAVDGLDSAFGFDAHEAGERIGWLFNVCAVRFGGKRPHRASAYIVFAHCPWLVFFMHSTRQHAFQVCCIDSSAR